MFGVAFINTNIHCVENTDNKRQILINSLGLYFSDDQYYKVNKNKY